MQIMRHDLYICINFSQCLMAGIYRWVGTRCVWKMIASCASSSFQESSSSHMSASASTAVSRKKIYIYMASLHTIYWTASQWVYQPSAHWMQALSSSVSCIQFTLHAIPFGTCSHLIITQYAGCCVHIRGHNFIVQIMKFEH